MNAVVEHEKQLPATAVFRRQLEGKLGELTEGLPPHIKPEQFKAVLMRAVMGDPDLLAADRLSLFEAAMAAANDGLLPDKREGAMVIYNTKVKDGGRDVWIKKVQWMPMIRGVITKALNTGKVKSISVDMVFAGDKFRHWKDDQGEHLFHEPNLARDENKLIAVYALVVMHDGGVWVEVMVPDQIDQVRKASKNPDKGPWASWWEEMAKKTVFRRLAKRLPISREIMKVLERDDVHYQWQDQPVIGRQEQPKSLAGRLDALAAPRQAEPTPEAEPVDDENGDAVDRQPDEQPADPVEAARAAGRAAREKGMARKAVPAEFRDDDALKAAFLEGFDGEEKVSEQGDSGDGEEF